MGPAFPTVTVINARAQTRKRVNLGLPAQPASAQVCSHISLHDLLCCDDCHMIFFLDSVAVQLTVEKRRKTGLLLELRSSSAPPQRATLPLFMALRTTSWKSRLQTAMGYPAVTDKENLLDLKRHFFNMD